MVRNLVLLSRFHRIGQVYFGRPASRPAFEDMALVAEAVEHGGDGGAVPKQFSQSSTGLTLKTTKALS
jgi:hypothetical protein